jgi:hypothetical protein
VYFADSPKFLWNIGLCSKYMVLQHRTPYSLESLPLIFVLTDWMLHSPLPKKKLLECEKESGLHCELEPTLSCWSCMPIMILMITLLPIMILMITLSVVIRKYLLTVTSLPQEMDPLPLPRARNVSQHWPYLDILYKQTNNNNSNVHYLHGVICEILLKSKFNFMILKILGSFECWIDAWNVSASVSLHTEESNNGLLSKCNSRNKYSLP